MSNHATQRPTAFVLGAIALLGILVMSVTPKISSAQKGLACGMVGCDDGDRDCAEITGTLNVDVGPLEAGASVTYFCREP